MDDLTNQVLLPISAVLSWIPSTHVRTRYGGAWLLLQAGNSDLRVIHPSGLLACRPSQNKKIQVHGETLQKNRETPAHTGTGICTPTNTIHT